MLLYISNFIIAILLPSLLLLVSWIVSARSSADREKFSPFECGFDPMNSARIPFSMRFFLLAVIFLVFDIEIALLMPIPLAIFSGSSILVLIVSMLFFIILILGLLHEWREGSLDWSE